MTSLFSTVTLSSPAGSVSLDDGVTHILLTGTTGLSGVSTELDTVTLPGLDGARLRGASTDRAGLRLLPTTLVLVVRVSAATPVAAADAVGELRRVLNSRRYGSATLTVVRADGRSRSLLVTHNPESTDFDPPEHGGSTWVVTLRLEALDPLWRGGAGLVGPWTVSTEDGGEFPIEWPWELATDRVIGVAQSVSVSGDEITWPIVRVWGPATEVEVTRGDARSYTLTPPGTGLAIGAELVIRHDPTSILSGLRVEGPAGANWEQYLDDAADLFELRPGVETLTVAVAGASAATEATVEWTARHWSALT